MYRIPNHRETFAFSGENPTGSRNGGTRGKDCEKLNACTWVEPGDTLTLVDTDGPGMITHIWLGGRLNHTAILRIYWDNNPEPSVEAPASAFFGNVYDDNIRDRNENLIILNSEKILMAPYASYNCYWEMPFFKHCRITLENRGKDGFWSFYTITGWHGELPENAGYFHAAYRQEKPITKGRAYTVLDNINGKGCFAGVLLAAGINGTSWIWVEGEVKMYIDGDTYPTINYTGTEDYFGGSYAFGNDTPHENYQTYSGQYVGMYAVIGNSMKKYQSQQRFLLYRWHVKDAIYFDKSFRMTMDNGTYELPMSPRYDDYTSVAFYYLTEPQAVPFELPSNDEMWMR